MRSIPLRSRGFTLIELMITVSIVAILASVAYPSYQGFVLKSKRAEARTALIDLLQQQERFMTQRNTYSNPVIPPGSTTVPFKTFAGDSREGTPYLLGTAVCGSGAALNICVRVRAVPQHSDPEAGEIWAESTGGRGCTGTRQPAVCWK